MRNSNPPSTNTWPDTCFKKCSLKLMEMEGSNKLMKREGKNRDDDIFILKNISFLNWTTQKGKCFIFIG